MADKKINFFADNLKVLREAKTKQTQEQAAKALNVERHTYGSWEQGRGTPQYDKLVEIAEHFGVSVDALLKTEVTVNAEVEPTKPALGLGAAYPPEVEL